MAEALSPNIIYGPHSDCQKQLYFTRPFPTYLGSILIAERRGEVTTLTEKESAHVQECAEVQQRRVINSTSYLSSVTCCTRKTLKLSIECPCLTKTTIIDFNFASTTFKPCIGKCLWHKAFISVWDGQMKSC